MQIMYTFVNIIIALLIVIKGIDGLDPCLNLPVAGGPTPIELPLCGNGVLDEGEICDDGNRLGGDGCNAWCSGFDRMTRVCTLAGQNPFYASGDQKQCLGTATAGLNFGPAQAFFCNLNAIAASPDGSYVVVAEGGFLVKMDLFTDSFSASLNILPATLMQPLVHVCSLFVVGTQSAAVIIAHECQEQSIVRFVNGGAQLSKPFTMPALKPSQRMRSYLDQDLLVLAGLTHTASTAEEGATCVHIYGFNTTITTTSNAPGTLLGSIECVVYNVIEKGLIYPSFSIVGMVPYQITKEPCPFQMQASACYVVHMERADMQVMKAYLSVDGGLDMHYTVSTDDQSNVLGAPLIAQGKKNRYTLTGNCFTMQQERLEGNLKRPPPMVALGNACGPMPFQPNSAQCSTPLNNPFTTDVASSSYLLPQGLSSRLQHQSLLNIFNASNLPLYRQILDNAHNGTVPIDFVELPGTLDVVYITKTTIGLISTKGIIHMDLFNPGYCRATQLIQCPSGFFGSVGTGFCSSCAKKKDSSVSAQIQCAGVVGGPQAVNGRRRHLLASASSAGFQTAPYTHMGLIVTKDVTQALLDALTSYYLVMKGFNCSADSGGMMTIHEPYNMQADYAEAQIQPPEKQLVTELVAQASARDAMDYGAQVSEEYLIGWTTQQTTLIDSLGKHAMIHLPGEAAFTLEHTCGLSSALINALDTSECRFKLNKEFHRDWLPCALPIAISPNNNNNSTGRSLLQVNDAGNQAIVMHSQSTFMSSTTVTYAPRISPIDDHRPTVSSSTSTLTGSKSSGTDPHGSMWIILGGVAGGLLVSVLLVAVLYVYCIASPSGQSQGEYKTA